MKNIGKPIAVLLALSLLTLAACGKGKTQEETTADGSATAPAETLQTETPSSYVEPATAAPVETTTVPVPVTAAPTQAPETQPAATQAPATQPAATEAPAPTEAPQQDVSALSKEQVLALLTEAVNKTKGYTAAITVHHKESFDFAITDVKPGGPLVQRALDFVTNLVIKPSEEDYHFSNGLATTSEGEQTQLLLPKDAPFSLPASGVASASASSENGMTHVVLTLAPEQCTSLTQVPVNHAASIGYLDIGGAFSLLRIQAVDIKYPGSVIDAWIRADGYVSAVTYTVKLDAYAEASAMGISGSAKFGGDQVEQWTINW